MADRTRDQYQALLVPDPRLSRWEAQSSYTQAGIHAGTPAPDRATDLALEGSGDQAATAYLSLARSGYPGQGWTSAGVLQRLTGADHWRGWRLPHTCTAWECVDWDTGVVTSAHPHLLTLTSGWVLMAHRHTTAVASYVRIRRRNPSTHAWSAVTVATLPAGFAEPCPCLALLDDGRILCAFVATGTTGNTVSVYYSNDDGATWALLSAPAIDLTESYVVTVSPVLRMRLVVLRGVVTLLYSVAGVGTLHLRQLASYDRGAHFALIEDFEVHDYGAFSCTGPVSWDVAVCQDHVLLVLACPLIGGVVAGHLEIRSLGAADQPISSAVQRRDWTAYPYDVDVWDVEVTVAVDDDQTAYLYVLRQDGDAGSPTHDERELVVLQTPDLGASLVGLGTSQATYGSGQLSHYWWSSDLETYPTDLSASVQRGRVLLAHRAECDPGTHGDSLFVAYLGGYSDVTLPPLMDWPPMEMGVSWNIIWYPYDLAVDVGWTWAGAGAHVLTSLGEQITTVANTGYNHRPPTAGTLARGVMGRFVVWWTSGGSLGNDTIAYRVRIGDGAAHDYRVSFRVAQTGIRVYDVHAAAVLDTIVATTANGVEVEYHLTEDGLVLQWRPWSTSEDHLWTRLGPYACADGGGAVANLVEWGHIDAGDAVSTWVESHYTSSTYVGLGWVGWTYPDDLYPRVVSTYPVWMLGGGLLSAQSGPGVAGDTWTWTPAYSFSVDHLDVLRYESPRQPWRSLTDGVVETIAFTLDATTADQDLDTDILGAFLAETNLQTVQIQGYVTGVGWTTILTLSSAVGTGLRWLRRGKVLVPDVAAGATAPYLLRGDLDGGTFIDGAEIHAVARATEGKFGIPTVTAVKQATVYLDTVGALGASGVAGALYAPRMAGALKLQGARYAGYRVRIPAQTTPQGYYQIGSLVIGSTVVFGWPTSRGRSWERESSAEVEVYRDGTRGVARPAPDARVWEVSWSEGIATRQAFSGTDPDHVMGYSGAGSKPVASLADTPWLLEQLYSDSAAGPLVYFQRIPYAGATWSQVHRDDAVLVAPEGSVRVETVAGDEGVNEFVRVGTVALREIR